MKHETIGKRDNIVIRRMILEPGEKMPWHVDPFKRISTVVRGEALRIEYLDNAEEVSFFFLDTPGAEPQPEVPT